MVDILSGGDIYYAWYGEHYFEQVFEWFSYHLVVSKLVTVKTAEKMELKSKLLRKGTSSCHISCLAVYLATIWSYGSLCRRDGSSKTRRSLVGNERALLTLWVSWIFDIIQLHHDDDSLWQSCEDRLADGWALCQPSSKGTGSCLMLLFRDSSRFSCNPQNISPKTK